MERWFSAGLVKWYQVNKRDLPWRHETDPYKIWLSEIILQQTQVAQGLSYYLKFIKKYPTVKALANATEDSVLKLWQGLGYYSRARNLHAAAKSVLKDHKGRFPASYDRIRGLKGVGEYTAAAVASFGYNLPHAVVDGNVYRVLSRIFGIESAIDSGAGKKQFQALANELLDKTSPATHNQAIMEFGALFCRPVNPPCGECVFRSKCYAFKYDQVDSLPVKTKKAAVRTRYFNYLVVADKRGHILLNRRNGKDIWQGLYEFRLVETARDISPAQLMKTKDVKEICGREFGIKYVSQTYKHVLSHQHLYTKFYVIRVNGRFAANSITAHPDGLSEYAFPRLIEKFLNDCRLKEIV